MSDIKGKLFGTDVSVFVECVDTLEKKGVRNSYIYKDGEKANKLCIDKYADTIPSEDWSYDKSSANTKGTITLKIQNNSSMYVIRKIEYSGKARCTKARVDDKSKETCEGQRFDGTIYSKIDPGSDRKISREYEFYLPTDIKQGEWEWWLYPDKIKAYGFILDY